MTFRSIRNHRSRKRLALAVGLAGLLAAPGVFSAPGTTPGSLLVDTAWLEANAANVRIVDYGRTRADCTQNHLPGAVYLDRTVVFDTVNGIEGDLPSRGEGGAGPGGGGHLDRADSGDL